MLERYAYTPWGERRDPSDWTKPDGRTEFFNNRGFTGHEHLDTFNLIDMGGRMYDPMLGTFLSIDPYIQAPDRWLNYNRYLYCYGNPLSYTDPSGENPFAIFGAAVLISTVVGAAMATYTGLQQGLVGEKLVNHILLGGAIGAVCGAAGGAVGCGVSAALGKVVAASFVGAGTIGAASGATAGFLNGSISTWINGGSFGEGILAGLEAGAYGAMSGFVLGGLTQGITNHLQGKNFWTGKAIAPVPQTSNSASSAASQSADMTLDEYEAQYNETNRIQVKDYHPRLSNKTYTYHNFPRMIEDKVIKYGIPSQRINDAAYWFEYNGSVNGVDGFFTIGINKDGVLFHRCFYPK